MGLPFRADGATVARNGKPDANRMKKGPGDAERPQARKGPPSGAGALSLSTGETACRRRLFNGILSGAEQQGKVGPLPLDHLADDAGPQGAALAGAGHQVVGAVGGHTDE